MNLKLVMYTSIATGGSSGLSSIVSECRKNNPVHNISGALYFSHRRFLQIIEGRAERIDTLMSNILKDSRHEQCLIQLDIEIKRLTFPSWRCQLNMVVSRDQYLQDFLRRYSAELNAMNAEQKAAFNHFLRKPTRKPNDNIETPSESPPKPLNVYGRQEIYLKSLPDSAVTDTSLFMNKLCKSLLNQSLSVEQLVREYGEDKRNDVLISLNHLNGKGLLEFKGCSH